MSFDPVATFFAIHPHVRWAVAALFGVLILANLATWGLGRMKPEMALAEVRLRIRTWWLIVVLFAGAITINQTVAVASFAALSALAFREYLAVIPGLGVDRRVVLWAYLAIPIQYLWVGMGWYGMFIIFVPVYMLLFLPMRIVLLGGTEGFLRAVGTVHWGLMMTVFCISHVAAMLMVPLGANPQGGGAGLVLFLVVLTQLNDVAQFIWGKTLGRHKVVPLVSPGKTYEGFVGGLATTTFLAWLLGPWLTPFSGGEALAAGLLIGTSGFIGDIVISALKRDLGIKDSGTMLPGHGGLLDRLDSLLYTAPLFFHYARYLGYVP